MTNDKKDRAISTIQNFIKEEFLDMTDPGDLGDKELFELDNSMGELARAVIHILGLQILDAYSDSEFTATISLTSTETMEI